MKERVAVLLGTVQFRLSVKVMVPENATFEDAEKAAWATIGNDPVRCWTLLDDLGVGPSMPLSLNDFLEVGLQRIETSVPDDQQREVLWEKEDG
jgi:hypothetical protein